MDQDFYDCPRFLKDEIPGLVEQGYEGDVPSMKVPPISNEEGTMTRRPRPFWKGNNLS